MTSLPWEDAVHPSPDEAHRWATEELAKAPYQKSFLQRFGEWLADLLSSLFQPGATAPGGAPAPTFLAALAALIVVGIIVWLLVKARRGRLPSTRDETATVFSEAPLSASEHRRRAREALAAGDRTTAVIEGFRAIAAGLVERHVLDEARDRTAREFALAAGSAFPAHGEGVRHAADLFEETLYGGRAPSETAAREVLALEEAMAAQTPRRVDTADMPAPLAVPR